MYLRSCLWDMQICWKLELSTKWTRSDVKFQNFSGLRSCTRSPFRRENFSETKALGILWLSSLWMKMTGNVRPESKASIIPTLLNSSSQITSCPLNSPLCYGANHRSFHLWRKWHVKHENAFNESCSMIVLVGVEMEQSFINICR